MLTKNVKFEAVKIWIVWRVQNMRNCSKYSAVAGSWQVWGNIHELRRGDLLKYSDFWDDENCAVQATEIKETVSSNLVRCIISVKYFLATRDVFILGLRIMVIIKWDGIFLLIFAKLISRSQILTLLMTLSYVWALQTDSTDKTNPGNYWNYLQI